MLSKAFLTALALSVTLTRAQEDDETWGEIDEHGRMLQQYCKATNPDELGWFTVDQYHA